MSANDEVPEAAVDAVPGDVKDLLKKLLVMSWDSDADGDITAIHGQNGLTSKRVIVKATRAGTFDVSEE